MLNSMKPIIGYSPLTGRWYVMTSYNTKKDEDGMTHYVADEKFDITDQMERILKKYGSGPQAGR